MLFRSGIGLTWSLGMDGFGKTTTGERSPCPGLTEAKMFETFESELARDLSPGVASWHWRLISRRSVERNQFFVTAVRSQTRKHAETRTCNENEMRSPGVLNGVGSEYQEKS